MKNMKLTDISTSENEFVAEAQQEYGKYFEHAQFAIDLMADGFMKSTSYEGAFFLMFFSTAQKHIILGALSGIRLHHVQANFDFRYAAEAGAWAAYALAHPKQENFALLEEDDTLEPTKELKAQMYQWLDEKYPAGSASLKRYKESTNKLSTHANIVDAHRNFGEMTREKITISFFDKPEEHHIKTDLWAAANLVMGLLDLFYGVNRDYPQLVLQDDFLANIKKLQENDAALKAEMMQHPKLKRFEAK